MAEQNLTDTIDFDRSVLGVDYDVGTHQVTKEQVVAYAQALGETNPLYLDEEAAKAGPLRGDHRAASLLQHVQPTVGPGPQGEVWHLRFRRRPAR